MINRQRGVSLEPSDIAIVRARVKHLQLTQVGWSIRANTSVSSVKRLLAGTRVELSVLDSSLKALNLDIEDFTIRKAVPTIPSGLLSTPTSSKTPDFYMRVTFSDTNRRQIRYALDDLRDLLDGQELVITPSVVTNSDNCVVISSDFPEHLRTQIEKVLQHIESLSETCVVKGDATIKITPRPLVTA